MVMLHPTPAIDLFCPLLRPLSDWDVEASASSIRERIAERYRCPGFGEIRVTLGLR